MEHIQMDLMLHGVCTELSSANNELPLKPDPCEGVFGFFTFHLANTDPFRILVIT